ncbi:MAG: DUF2007 domain-containing protein, partial [bacterium]|nr:DUF2007 domain-containing protein [bacterium]
MGRADTHLHSLYRTNFPLESEALCDLLTSNGIPAMARWSGMAPQSMRAPAPDLSISEVVIYRQDLDTALEVLRSHHQELTLLDRLQQEFTPEQRDVLRAYDIIF